MGRACLHLGVLLVLAVWSGCAVRDLNGPTGQNGEPVPSGSGADWEKTAPLPEPTVRALVFSANKYLTAGGESGRIYRSKNSGDAWQAVAVSNAAILSFALDENGVLYAGSDGEGIFVSRFNGKSWETGTLVSGHVHALLVLPEGVLLAGLSNGLWQRGVSSAQWELVPLPTLGTRQIFSLLRSGVQILAGTDLGMFRSPDGQRWQSSGLDELPVTALARSPAGWFFAGTATNGIWRSADGANWFPANEGLEASSVYALAVNSLNFVFAATENGVFYSGDLGQSWASFRDGLPEGRVLALVLDAQDKLYAAVEGAGVFRTVGNTRFR